MTEITIKKGTSIEDALIIAGELTPRTSTGEIDTAKIKKAFENCIDN